MSFVRMISFRSVAVSHANACNRWGQEQHDASEALFMLMRGGEAPFNAC
jgi:hypothetical protein